LSTAEEGQLRSPDRFTASYVLEGPTSEAPAKARALAVEQSIEFPPELVTDRTVRDRALGRVESVREIGEHLALARLSFGVDTIGFELPQLLQILFGNCSMYPWVRLVGFDLSEELLAPFRGPRYGVSGVRNLTGAGNNRPLLATALKPMGLTPTALARMAATLASDGIDLIKDDQSLADQSFAQFRERVKSCAQAVAEANSQTGRQSLYLPSMNAPADEIRDRAVMAKELGAGGLLVCPGLSGYDTMRVLAADDEIGLPIMAHPTFLGSLVAGRDHGIDHGIVFGTLMRLAGADVTAFPNYGGRFSFPPEACRQIAECSTVPLGNLAAILPAPGGGMTVDRVNEILDFYGNDCAILIGGALHRGDLGANVRLLRDAVDIWSDRSAQP
jgi:ribulose-bisphosphate carboxylase large chain